jgi:NAD(P)-dependent dehydrogenase (short-subunit alcohol dehydrogenase family)
MTQRDKKRNSAEHDNPPEQVRIPAEGRGEVAGRGRLAGRRILVVGAGTRHSDEPNPPIGNGRAIAILAAREGATIACADVSEAAARETLESIEREGGQGSVVVADVSEEEACARVIVEAERALGGLDGLVLNVGIAEGLGLEGTTAKNWDRTFSVNLRAHFLIARAALPRFGPGASVVFISSVAGRRPGSRLPAYDASKAGLEGLCRHVALEGARLGVRANLVVPGLIDTPLGRLATRGRPERGRARIPLGRQGTAWEIAYATAFLLSDEASYVTAQSLVIDGGVSELR